MTCTDNVCGTGGYSGPQPGDPDSNSILTATPAFGGIDVEWTPPGLNPHAVAFTRIFRSLTSDVNGAVRLVDVGGTFYYDKVDSATRYYYWIQFFSANIGLPGDMIGPATAIARPAIAEVIEQLTAQIDAGMLAQSLKQEIDRIHLISVDLAQEITDRIGANSELAASFAQFQNTVDSVATMVDQEIAQRTSGQSALVDSIAVMAAKVDQNAAAILQADQLRVSGDASLASSLTQLSATVTSNFTTLNSAIQQESTTRSTNDSANAQLITTVQATADSKGKTLFQSTAPAVADQLAQNLWIDTTNGANTPKRWNGSSWVTVTDKAATDAAAAAAAAQSTANTAQSNAAAAQTSANTANNLLADIASDAKLTATEKQQVKKEWDTLAAEKSGIDQQATDFGITTEKTAYDNQYSTLSTYITPLLANLEATSDITATTFRTNFTNFYSARQTLLNAIAAKAKALADTAQAAANAAQNTANTATAAVQNISSAKIGYAAVTGSNQPYDGDGTTIVYPVATYPAATYPEYAVDRTRIIDKVGVTNWNATPAGTAKPLTWLVGMPLATAVQTVQVTGPDGSAASMQQAFSAQKTLNDGFKAQYTAKVTVTGTDGTKLIGGFGVYGDPTGIEAGFDVDKFWIGRTGPDKKKPFIVSGGQVYIDDAVIQKLTFDKLRAADGSFIVSGGKVQMQYLQVTEIMSSNYSGWGWPASGQTGFYLGPNGLLMGNGNDNKYVRIDSTGSFYAPGMSIVNGVLTISQINVIGTDNITNRAVTDVEPYTWQFNYNNNYSVSFNVSIPAGSIVALVANASGLYKTGNQLSNYAYTFSLNLGNDTTGHPAGPTVKGSYTYYDSSIGGPTWNKTTPDFVYIASGGTYTITGTLSAWDMETLFSLTILKIKK